jgi:hypothetical protein
VAEDKYNERYWSSELSRSKEEHQKFIEDAEESIKTYSGQHKLPDCDRRLNVWWSLTQTLLPAYFSRAPKIETDLRKKQGGDLERLSAIAIERATQYVLDEENDTQSVAQDAVLQFCLTGRGVVWNRYEAAMGSETYEYALFQNEKGEFIDEQGEPYQGDTSLIQQNGTVYSVKEDVPSKTTEKALIEAVHFRDYLSSCARNESEVEWKARRAFLTRSKAREKFGKDTADSLSYDAYPEDVKRGKGNEIAHYEGKAELWEIWCIESNKVYWLNQSGQKFVLESGEPPLKYKNFWPCSELCANSVPNSVIPIGDYFLVKDLLIEVERLTSRIHATVQAIRSNGAYDATIGSELETILTGDLKLVPVKNWPTHKTQRGGLSNMMEFLPIETYIRGLDTLINAREAALNKLYEITGASDLIRGATSPIETATAQQLKSNYTNLRFSVRQRHVYEFLNEAVERLGETVCEHYSPEKLWEISNGEQLVAQYIDPNNQMTPEMKWQAIVDLLRDDPKRRYKIEITTDSMVALDERADRAERVDLLQSTGSFLSQLEQMVQNHPSLFPMAMELLKFTTRSYRAGKELESVLSSTLQNIYMEIEQKKQQPPPQDPAMVDSQTRLQIAQLNAQTEQNKMQILMQESMQKAETEQFRIQTEVQMEQQKASLDVEKTKLEFMKHELEANLKMQELELKAQELSSKNQQKEAETILDLRTSEFKTMLDQQKMELERYRVQLETYEKLIEERRLAMSAKKKKGRITRDESGNATIEIDEELVV